MECDLQSQYNVGLPENFGPFNPLLKYLKWPLNIAINRVNPRFQTRPYPLCIGLNSIIVDGWVPMFAVKYLLFMVESHCIIIVDTEIPVVDG